MSKGRWLLNTRFTKADLRAAHFAFKVWLAANLLAPIFTTGYYGLADISVKRLVGTYGIFVSTGALLSAPSFLVFTILCMVVAGMHYQFVQFYRKTILSILGFLFTAIPFSLVGLGIFGGDLLIFLPYACFVLAGIWYFKLGKETDDEDTTSQ